MWAVDNQVNTGHVFRRKTFYVYEVNAFFFTVKLDFEGTNIRVFRDTNHHLYIYKEML